MSFKRKKTAITSSTNSTSSATPGNNSFDASNPSTATIDVVAVEIPELTLAEERLRLDLERKIECAFFEAGKALAQLRDRKLYRSTHKTFEEYCHKRFGYTHRYANHLIAASNVFGNIRMGTTNCSQNELVDQTRTNTLQILPTSERQVRPLAKLKPTQQQEVWLLAVEEAGGKVPTGKIVKEIVQRVIEPIQIPNTYQLGEVCQIQALDNAQLKGKNGCWAIVSTVNDFDCTVKMWDGEYTVALKHLKSCGYLPSQCEQMQSLCDRIGRVYSTELEESVQKFLESLGKLNSPYLTALEEKLLSVLESEIRV